MARDPSRFKGLLTNSDPKDIPPGFFAAQRNLGCFRPGRLDVRPGIHAISNYLTNITAADSESKIGIFAHAAPHATWLVGHRTDGSVKAHRDLSGATATLIPASSNFDADYPASFVRDSLDGLLVFNGLERGYRWDGLYKGTTASAFQAGVESPEDVGATTSQKPTLADDTGTPNKLTPSSQYTAGYRYRDFLGYTSNLSDLRVFTSHSSGYAQVWSSLLASTQNADSTQYRAKYVELFRSVADVPGTLYLVARLGNRGTIASATGNGVTTTITLEFGHGLVAGAVVSITGVTGLTTLTVASVTDTTATGSSAYNGTDSDGGAWAITGFTLDTLTDDDLLDRSVEDKVDLFNEDGTIFARSFGLPPDDKPFFASFQGVMFAYGRVHYSIGTASGTSGTKTITLSASAQVKTEWINRLFVVSSTGVKYTITAVNEGANTLTLDRNLPSTLSAVSYVVTPDQTRANLLCFSRPGFQEGFLETDAIRVQQPSDATDRETGLLQFGPYLYILHEYHIYQVTFSSDPRYDGQVTLSGYRGAVNNRSCAVDHGTAYLFDQKGGYTIEGPCCPQDITSPLIRNLFQSTIDWSASKKKWYFASLDPAQRVVRYHVSYTGDSATYPKRAICYNTQSGQWWEEEYPFEICGAAEYEISGQLRLVLAGPNDQFLVSGNLGTGDGTMTPVSGVVTDEQGTYVVVAAATFTAGMVGHPIQCISGPGAGETGIISVVSNEFGVDVTNKSSGFSNIAPGSVIVVGAISSYLKTGMLEILPPQDQADGKPAAVAIRRKIEITYEPTTNDALLRASIYLNSESTAQKARSNTTIRGVAWENGSEYMSFSSKKSLMPRGEEPGRKIIPLDSTVSAETRGDLFLTARLDAMQGTSQLSIRSIEPTGFG